MFLNFFFFLLMENLGAMAYLRYTGFREIMDHDVLELHCIWIFNLSFCFALGKPGPKDRKLFHAQLS